MGSAETASVNMPFNVAKFIPKKTIFYKWKVLFQDKLWCTPCASGEVKIQHQTS